MRITLPLPPSVNNLFPTVRDRRTGALRRVRSRIYDAWQWEALVALKSQPTGSVLGPYRLRLLVPEKARADVSNYLKAAEDFCVFHRLTSDDRHCVSATAERSADVKPGLCIIEIEAAK